MLLSQKNDATAKAFDSKLFQVYYYMQKSFTSEMEWALFTDFYSSSIFIKICQIMTAITNAENLWHSKSRFTLILEQILAFTSNTILVKEMENMSPNFKLIAWWCFTSLNVLIQIVVSTLSLNVKQFPQMLNSNTLCVVDITC